MFALLGALCASRRGQRHHRHHRTQHRREYPIEKFEEVSNSLGDSIASYAKSKIGCSYVYGAAGPNTFDCSGLSQWCHAQCGISIPRTADAQAASGSYVSSPAAGDVVWFDFGSGVGHVGIMVDGSNMVHAPNSNKKVQQVSVSSGYWAGVSHGYRRYW